MAVVNLYLAMWKSTFINGLWLMVPSWTVSLQSGRGAEPGVLLPDALLWPLQTGHHRLDAAVSARPRPACVRTHRHGLTSPPPVTQGQRSNFHSGSGPKAQSVFIYFFNRLARLWRETTIIEVKKKKKKNTKHCVDIVWFSCSLYRLLLPYTWPM